MDIDAKIVRKHRGLAPEDKVFFDKNRLSSMQKAVFELTWLLRRGYAIKASLELVGNRHQLIQRERLAISHASWNKYSRNMAKEKEELIGKNICIDGFNLLITLETALGGGIVLKCMDGCYRDIANVHGSYKIKAETEKAIYLAGKTLKNFGVKEAIWLFDRPVSNSGRIAKLLNDISDKYKFPMLAKTADQVDTKIKNCDGIVVTADSGILDNGIKWFDLSKYLIENEIKDTHIVDLGKDNDANIGQSDRTSKN